jgi:hypothetical protein
MKMKKFRISQQNRTSSQKQKKGEKERKKERKKEKRKIENVNL